MFCGKNSDSFCTGEVCGKQVITPHRTVPCFPEGLRTVGTLGRFYGGSRACFARSFLLHGQLFSEASWVKGVSIAFDVIINVKGERPGRAMSIFTIKLVF